MRPQVESVTGVGFTDPIFVDRNQPQFKIGVGCVVSGTVLYSMQHTFDALADFTDAADYNANATWFDSDDPALVSASTNQDSNFAYPVQSVRIENLATSTGTTTMTLLQGD